MKSIVPVITAQNLALSLRFYTEKLGFKIVDRYPQDDPLQRVVVSLDDRPLIIMGKDSMGIEADEFSCEMITNHPGVGIQFRFEVEDVDRYYEEILSYGIRIAIKPHNTSFPKGENYTGMREFVLRDPDGYFLVFASSLPGIKEKCISCGTPLTAKGQSRLCHGCSDGAGSLLPFGQVLENTIEKLFGSTLGMDRSIAVNAALDHLRRMPAWK